MVAGSFRIYYHFVDPSCKLELTIVGPVGLNKLVVSSAEWALGGNVSRDFFLLKVLSFG